jgi:hypothetical protein
MALTGGRGVDTAIECSRERSTPRVSSRTASRSTCDCGCSAGPACRCGSGCRRPHPMRDRPAMSPARARRDRGTLPRTNSGRAARPRPRATCQRAFPVPGRQRRMIAVRALTRINVRPAGMTENDRRSWKRKMP